MPLKLDWLERMNWAFLEEETAAAVWDEARRLFFKEDKKLEDAFTEALETILTEENA